jgi:hypothetical protein
MRRNFLNAVCIVVLVLTIIAASDRIFETSLFASEQACHCCGHSSTRINSVSWQPLFLSPMIHVSLDSTSVEIYVDRTVFFNTREYVRNIFHPPNC